MIIQSQKDIIEFLSRPETYGPAVKRVERIDTHVSVLFLAGNRAFKLKRAVKFPYLDFSTVAKRRDACEAEVRINRRTAPTSILGLSPLRKAPKGKSACRGRASRGLRKRWRQGLGLSPGLVLHAVMYCEKGWQAFLFMKSFKRKTTHRK